jgi:hypothetical protein
MSDGVSVIFPVLGPLPQSPVQWHIPEDNMTTTLTIPVRLGMQEHNVSYVTSEHGA